MLNTPKVVRSHTIKAYDYDANTYGLTVWFNGGDEYHYDHVTPDVMSSVFDTPGSVGSKFYRLIVKGKYKVQKQ